MTLVASILVAFGWLFGVKYRYFARKRFAAYLKPVHTGDYSPRFRRQFVAENGDCRFRCRPVTKGASVRVVRTNHPTRSQGPLYDMQAPDWQRISPADRPTTVSAAVKLCSKTDFPQCSRLARHCLHDTCYIVRVRKNRQLQLASATDVHSSHERQWLSIASAVWH